MSVGAATQKTMVTQELSSVIFAEFQAQKKTSMDVFRC
ncbi:hypothetical protein C4J99_4882 [Pseudomonas synxantha]|nr:hypothetical protein C4J99_4882 [Pseudomonas synxantha]